MIAANNVAPPVPSTCLLSASTMPPAPAIPRAAFDCAEPAATKEAHGSALWLPAAPPVPGIGLEPFHLSGMIAMQLPVFATGFTLSNRPADFASTISLSQAGTLGVSVFALAILGLVSIAAVVDRRFRELRLKLARAESAVALSEAGRQSALSDMAASIVHEIRQPLAVVVTEVSASLRWLAHSPPDMTEARESLARAIQNANRASEVAGRIGALLRKAPPPLMRLDAGEVILEALHLARGTLSERGILVKTDLDPDAPMAIGDRIQLQQLVLNLIMNAVDAMSTVTDRPRELFIRLSASSYEILVQVQDSGRGLDPEHAPHIFDPFYSTKPHGIGMGLSLCRSIVQVHGGRLWAVPGSPYGTIFQFTLRKAEKQHG